MATPNKRAKRPNEEQTALTASFQIGKLIDNWFKIGSYPLVAIGIGAVLTIMYVFALNTAFVNRAPLPNGWDIVIWLGILLMSGGFAAVIIGGALAHRTVQRTVKKYEKTIETARDFSEESIKTIRSLNELLFTHVDTVAQVIDAAEPILKMFGGSSFANSRYLESDLVAFSNKAQEVISNVQKAISEADFNALMSYCGEIRQISATTSGIVERVKRGDWAAERVSEFTDSISNTRQAALAYSEGATKIYERFNAVATPIITRCQLAQDVPFVGEWLNKYGISKHVSGLQHLQKILHTAQAANLAVSAAIAAPGKDKLNTALLHMQSLRNELASDSLGDFLSPTPCTRS